PTTYRLRDWDRHSSPSATPRDLTAQHPSRVTGLLHAQRGTIRPAQPPAQGLNMGHHPADSQGLPLGGRLRAQGMEEELDCGRGCRLCNRTCAHGQKRELSRMVVMGKVLT
ncbi:hypothetical protein P7K49_030985, partial [Saguinus oedipus]